MNSRIMHIILFFSFTILSVGISQIDSTQFTCGMESGDTIMLASLTRPSLQNTISTARFVIHFDTVGTNACPRSYAQNIAVYAESAWTVEVDNMHWKQPNSDLLIPNNGGDGRYDIYIVHFARPDTAGATPKDSNSSSSFMLISNILPTPSVVKITVAHEFNHACQWSYNTSVVIPWIWEGTAMWISPLVFPEAFSTYSSQVATGFWNANVSITQMTYGNGLWCKFLNEWVKDSIFTRKLWERMDTTGGAQPLNDITTLLSRRNITLDSALEQYAIWRNFIGLRADRYHWSDGQRYYDTLHPTFFPSYPHYDIPFTVSWNDSGLRRPSGPGGCEYLSVPSVGTALTVHFDGANSHNWSVFLIAMHLADSSLVYRIPIVSYLDTGSITVPTVNADSFVIVPVVLNLSGATNLGFDVQGQTDPRIGVTFSNRVHDIEEGGSLVLDNVDTLTSGQIRLLNPNASHVVRTLNERFEKDTIYKHHDWNGNLGHYKIVDSFFVSNGTNELANFLALQHVTLRNEIIDAPQFNGGTIDFRDPWCVDSLGNQPDTFKSFGSPFVPTGAYNQSAGGVFLNQRADLPGNPYYSVRVPQTQTIGIFQCTFDHWDTSGVSLVPKDSTPGFIQRAVVFRSPNAIVKAMYHATIASDTVPVLNHWNMVSVPVVPSSFAKTAIWPNSNSNAFTYISGNNVQEDTIHNGIGYWLSFPQADSLHYVGGPITTESIRVNTGWNMIGSLSLPLPKTKVYPDTTIISNYFGYTSGYGYYPSDTLQTGNGYWIDVNQAGSLVLDISGAPQSGNGNGGSPPCPPFAPPVPNLLSPGIGTTGASVSPTLSWNASTCATKYHLQLSHSAYFDSLIVDDSTITGTSRQVNGLSYSTIYLWRVSSINGYGSSDWSSSWYFVTGSNNPPPPCQCCANMLTDLDQLSVGDASGSSQRLYLVHGARQMNLGFTNYTLPPETPHGAFGARFGSGRFIESIPADSQSRVRLPIRVKDITFPLTIKWKLKNENALRYWLTLPGTQGQNKIALNGQTGNTSVSGTDNGTLILNVQPMMRQPCPPNQGTVERFGDIEEQKEIPAETKLFPNYPNPFNPSTTFAYQLSTPGIVQMKVYNLLGEEVAKLVDNESKDAGYYSATWNATNMASGIYYVRMIITDKTDKQVYQNVNKLILLK